LQVESFLGLVIEELVPLWWCGVGIDSKAAGQRMILPNIGKNLSLDNNGSNGDSVPATVPGSELVGLTCQRLNLGRHPHQLSRQSTVAK
jgi:hypothetical protein